MGGRRLTFLCICLEWGLLKIGVLLFVYIFGVADIIYPGLEVGLLGPYFHS